jgi:hypothetical protein
MWQEVEPEKTASDDDGPSIIDEMYSLVNKALTGW